MLVNCAWGEWSAYTGCTKTCGGGKQYRYRTILTHGESDGTACVGTDNVEEQACNSATCPGQYYYNMTKMETPRTHYYQIDIQNMKE